MKLRFLLALAGASFAVTPASAQQAEVKLWRLDCGTVAANDLNAFSDTKAYTGKSKQLASSCYLIQHGSDYMLWDTGLPAAMKGKPLDNEAAMDATVTLTIKEQLATLNVDPASIKYVAVSHYHFDHIGQLAEFPGATLLVGKNDWQVVTTDPATYGADPKPFEPWIKGGSKVEAVANDKDVFGDGSITMLRLPGHTPGHNGLLVRLKKKPVLLTGDLAHFTENYKSNGVPTFNYDRAETLASLDRFKKLADNLGATVIIQHEPADIKKLPAFPQAAE
ncbi:MULTISPECIES: N-acyl homoserine lactonase family protein [Pseudomonadota]|jgi:glyoxylase-like metal-dependent hydrolase (beta-lactamase superfamily II)|uniref:Acylhomoserine lactonase n=1 Tax=Sphingomonas ursincola TaxID=56361 RepID=A0A1E1FFR3_9SPHN|nr:MULTISPECIES: N-acyl homoserine lactonase family protein [Pseudomonadota]BAV69344.1 acylhomoserine lactonase [Sphingomonas ursincola]|tara:strand:+ start:94562 stop:95395 length:834 start_codon:yes stop_codon:yes gene_type:complete